jgi:hypothetical protein
VVSIRSLVARTLARRWNATLARVQRCSSGWRPSSARASSTRIRPSDACWRSPSRIQRVWTDADLRECPIQLSRAAYLVGQSLSGSPPSIVPTTSRLRSPRRPVTTPLWVFPTPTWSTPTHRSAAWSMRWPPAVNWTTRSSSPSSATTARRRKGVWKGRSTGSRASMASSSVYRACWRSSTRSAARKPSLTSRSGGRRPRTRRFTPAPGRHYGGAVRQLAGSAPIRSPRSAKAFITSFWNVPGLGGTQASGTAMTRTSTSALCLRCASSACA